MKLWTWLFVAVVLSFLGCSCGDESRQGSTTADDDTSPDDDDDTGPDDDDNDDDNDDNNDDDTSPPFQSIEVYNQDGLTIEMVAGGAPGHNGLDVVSLADGTAVIAAVKGRTLILYYVAPDQTVTQEIVAHFAAAPVLARDTHDNLHIAYFDLRQYYLIYGRKLNPAWVFSPIAAYNYYHRLKPPLRHLCVDDQGIAHTAFLLDYTSTIVYAENATGDWTQDLIETGTQWFPTVPAIATESNGTPHLLYHLNYSLRHATKTRDGWDVEVVDDARDVEEYDILTDTAGGIHIAYFDDDAGRLDYGFNNGGEWTFETIRHEGTGLKNLKIELDDHANLYLYTPFTNQHKLYEFVKSSGAWSSRLVTTEAYGVFFMADHHVQNAPFVAHYDDRFEDHVMLWRGGSLTWVGQIVDQAPATQSQTSVVTTSDAAAALAFSTLYRDPPDQSLTAWVAQERENGWKFSTLGYGTGMSLQVRDNDDLAISYFDVENEILYYAEEGADEWPKEVVPSPSASMSWTRTSLAFDQNGRPGIGACGGSVLDIGLMYGDKRGGSWESTGIYYQVWDYDCTARMIYNQDNQPRLVFMEDHEDPYRYYRWLYYVYPMNEELWRLARVEPQTIGSDIGYSARLIQDSTGQEFLCYDSQNGITLAKKTGVADWDLTRVVDHGGAGHSVGCAVDSADQVYLAYSYSAEIRAGTFVGDEWVERTIDWGGDFGGNGANGSLDHLEMAIGPDDYVHLVYHDEGAVWHTVFHTGYVTEGLR